MIIGNIGLALTVAGLFYQFFSPVQYRLPWELVIAPLLLCWVIEGIKVVHAISTRR